MNAEDLGVLVFKIQDDDIRPSELRKFLEAVVQDEEVRRNAALVGKLSGLSPEVRRQHCLANSLFLLSHESLAPKQEASLHGWRNTTNLFADRHTHMLRGPWGQHIKQMGTPTMIRVTSRSKKLVPSKPPLQVSKELTEFLKALENFWDVWGLLLES